MLECWQQCLWDMAVFTNHDNNNAKSCSTDHRVPEGLQFTAHLPAHGHAGKRASCCNRSVLDYGFQLTHVQLLHPGQPSTTPPCHCHLSLMLVEATGSGPNRPFFLTPFALTVAAAAPDSLLIWAQLLSCPVMP